MAIASATEDRITVVTRDKGQKGDTGEAGIDGQGFNGVRQSLLDAPLCRLFTPNKLVDTLAGSLTATRATTATYVDRYGIVKTAAIDEMREESEGWLIEGASTNLLTYSEQFDNADWQQFVYTSIWNKVDNSIDIDAPDGSQSATKLVSLEGGGPLFARRLGLSLGGGSTYSASIWVYVPSQVGVENFNFFANYEDNDFSFGELKVQFDQWIRLSATSTLTFSQSGVDFEISVNGGNPLPGFEFYIWGAQLEALPFASSYIPTTTAAATRSADVITAPVRDNFVSGNQGDWSFSCTLKTLGASVQVLYDHSGIADIPTAYSVIIGTAGDISVRDFNTTEVAVGVADVGSLVSFVAAREAQNLIAYVNGDSGIASQPSSQTNFNLEGTVRIGALESGFSLFYGHIRDFRIYDFALNADEAAYLAGVK